MLDIFPLITGYNLDVYIVITLQLAIMGGPLERVRRADNRVNDGALPGRSHGHAGASAQFASE